MNDTMNSITTRTTAITTTTTTTDISAVMVGVRNPDEGDIEVIIVGGSK